MDKFVQRSLLLFIWAVLMNLSCSQVYGSPVVSVFSCERDTTITNKFDSVHRLREVEVVARSNRDIIPAQVMQRKDIERVNSLSVADAIRYFSGVQLKDYGGVAGLKTINIRSMGTNHMGVFYNGIQLGNAQNGQVDLGRFSLDNIESISLYNGQKSEIFQSARDFGSAGTIYLTTRVPKFKEGKTSNFRAAFKTGSFDLVNPSLLMEQKLSENISASFSGEWINSSGKYKFRYRRRDLTGAVAYDTTAVRQNGDINATRMEGSLDGRLKNATWKVHAYNYNSERGIPGAIVNNVWRNGERLWDINSFIQSSFRMQVTEKYRTMVNVKYAADYTHYINNDSKLIAVDNKYKQKEIYFSTANVYSILKNWDVSLSYDFQWNKLDTDLKDFPFPTRNTHWISAATSFNWGRLKGQASALGTIVRETVRRYSKSPDKNVFTPAVFLAYQPFAEEPLTIRAFYKKIFRMPTFNDLYYTDMGNSNLKPEYATQYNAGVQYNKEFKNSFYKLLNIQVDAYYNEVTDKIIAYPKGQQFRWTMLNLGKVEIRGIDVSMHNQFSFWDAILNINLQYTYQKAQDFTDPSDNYYRHQIPYIPWHSGSAIAGIDWRSWSLNYSLMYVGERYNQQENIRYNHTQPWYTSDLSLAKSFTWKGKQLKVSLDVNNLLDQDYDVILNYPMPMRNYRVSLSIDI